jgi:hypothetical protein
VSARLLTHDEVSALPNMDKPWGIHRDEHGTYALTFDELRARLNDAAPNLRATALDLFAQLAAVRADHMRPAGATEETVTTKHDTRTNTSDLLMFSAREAKAMLDGGVASITGNEFNGVTVARLAMAVVHYAEALNGVSKRGKRAAALVTTMEDRADAAEAALAVFKSLRAVDVACFTCSLLP